jgi:anthranilate synthase/aminodeoxychorismate synthase-like glutamine amidotransferase
LRKSSLPNRVDSNVVILLLDNYDSFVHNLARYFRRLGCETRVVRSDQIDREGCRRLRPQGIVVSPGPRRPEQAGCSIDVITNLSLEIPILGVCLGHQAIAVAFGGVVVRCGPTHGMASQIQHDGQGIFHGCPSPMRVGRYHSLAMDPDRVPDDLQVTARSDDGVIMGIQHRSRPVYGVQFHPESVLTDAGLATLSNFVSMVSSLRQATAS